MELNAQQANHCCYSQQHHSNKNGHRGIVASLRSFGCLILFFGSSGRRFGDLRVRLISLQAEGGKRMAAPDYFRGHPLD